MPELAALDLAPGPEFVDALRTCWEAGDAVLPVDQRLPGAAMTALFEELRPGRMVTPDGVRRLRGGTPTAEGDALVVPTSGSTGAPKGVVLTHDALAASARASSARLDVDPSRDRWVACLPLAHIGGLAVVVRALLTGTPVTVLERFEPDRVEQLAKEGATRVALVATTLARLDASGYRTVLLGGGAPPARLPENVVTTYGMTETGSGVLYDGRPLDGVEVRVGGAAPDVGGPAGGTGAGGAGGEVLLRGPMLLRCYRDGTDPRRAGGWFPTGDAGQLSADGILTVHGRMAEVIVTGGEKVWPEPVERVLVAHPDVAAAAVGKRPDPEWGERVVAWVVPRDPQRPPALAELRATVAAELAPWAAPRELVVVPELPLTASGKVRRSALSAPGRPT
jgi:o-succinylbenzoate---CoA ligase